MANGAQWHVGHTALALRYGLLEDGTVRRACDTDRPWEKITRLLKSRPPTHTHTHNCTTAVSEPAICQERLETAQEMKSITVFWV